MLQGKPDPESVVESKALISKIFDKLTSLSENPDQSFFNANIAQVISDHFTFKHKDTLCTLSLQSPTWRLFHALFDYLDSTMLQQVLPEPESIFT